MQRERAAKTRVCCRLERWERKNYSEVRIKDKSQEREAAAQ